MIKYFRRSELWFDLFFFSWKTWIFNPWLQNFNPEFEFVVWYRSQERWRSSRIWNIGLKNEWSLSMKWSRKIPTYFKRNLKRVEARWWWAWSHLVNTRPCQSRLSTSNDHLKPHPDFDVDTWDDFKTFVEKYDPDGIEWRVNSSQLMQSTLQLMDLDLWHRLSASFGSWTPVLREEEYADDENLETEFRLMEMRGRWIGNLHNHEDVPNAERSYPSLTVMIEDETSKS